MIRNIWKHFCTITRHKLLVGKGCFRVGLYKQGLLHDLSKYSPSEFWVGVKYYQGNQSPNNRERNAIGYSSAWLHHKGRNKHHYEYWIDYSTHSDRGIMVPVKMPDRYLAEMIIDRIAASKVYKGRDYTDACPLEYYYLGTHRAPIEESTKEKLLFYLELLAREGEEETFRRMKKELVHR